MKLIILDTYYPGFLKSFYNEYRNLQSLSFNTHKRLLLDSCFGTSDYYSYNLKLLGHCGEEIIVNDRNLQIKWAKENNLKVSQRGLLSIINELPYAYKFIGRPSWLWDIVEAQIQDYRPDVIYVQDLSLFNLKQQRKLKKYCKFLAGQIASSLPGMEGLGGYDLILTSFPHFVEIFQKNGIKSEYFKIGFEKRVYEKIGKLQKKYDVTFVGSFSPYHKKSTKILEYIADNTDLNLWGNGMNFVSPLSSLHRCFKGQAWGFEMYKILAQSKIVINRHSGISGNFANNMRLFEVTGMGALLITDWKKNLGEMFVDGKEVVSYRRKEDLLLKIRYYLDNWERGEQIAQAGLRRTHQEHTYFERMRELTGILSKYI